MYAKVYAATLIGLEGKLVEVECGLLSGLTSFSIVGLPDQSINESKERITLAIRSIKAKPPLKFNRKTIINLAPADLKKEGPILDLAIAISFLITSKQLSPLKKRILFLGELGLDGQLRRVKGALPILLSLRHLKFDQIYLPAENFEEIKYLQNFPIVLLRNLAEVVAQLEGTGEKNQFTHEPFQPTRQRADLSFLKLPEQLMRIIQIVAAGKHNLLLYGPPGTGKTLIAQNLVHLLPPLTYQEALEVTSIYSTLDSQPGFITQPPLRSPHHSASATAILGGGANPKPGEISLAHRGLLFFDELPEFHRDVLEGLREPLEHGEITVARAKHSVKFPANFLFVGAYNPCPCGFYDDPEKDCRCSAAEIKRYRRKLSGPIIDRLDIFSRVPRIKSEEIFTEQQFDLKQLQESIAEMKQQQFQRQHKYNGELTAKELKQFCQLTPAAEQVLRQAVDRFRLSLRGLHKTIKVARTIADFAHQAKIDQPHVAEALQYRFQENE